MLNEDRKERRMMGLIFDEVLDGREGESLEGNIERLEG